MDGMASQITCLTIVYSIIYSGADQGKIKAPSLAFVRGIHRWPVNFPHKGPVTRKMIPFDGVIMTVKQPPVYLMAIFLIAWSFVICVLPISVRQFRILTACQLIKKISKCYIQVNGSLTKLVRPKKTKGYQRDESGSHVCILVVVKGLLFPLEKLTLKLGHEGVIIQHCWRRV